MSDKLREALIPAETIKLQYEEMGRLRAELAAFKHSHKRLEKEFHAAKAALLGERKAFEADLTSLKEAIAASAPDDGWVRVDDVKQALMKRYYGAPSSWGAKAPEQWHLSDECTPRDAAMHDNGLNDALMALADVRAAYRRARKE